VGDWHSGSMCDCYAKYVLAGLISGTDPGTNPGGMRNVKRIQAPML